MKTKSITLLSILALFFVSQLSFACSSCGCSSEKKAELKEEKSCQKTEGKKCDGCAPKSRAAALVKTTKCPKGCTKTCCTKAEVKKAEKKACPEGCKKTCCKPAEAVWHTDFAKAQKLAKDSGKPILMNFSGSDWCYWCIKLDKEVFHEKAFKEYAAENVVLVLVDTPSKVKQPAELKKQNDALKAKYSIRGFPTVILLDSEGEKVAQTGYQDGGAKKYVEHIKSLLE